MFSQFDAKFKSLGTSSLCENNIPIRIYIVPQILKNHIINATKIKPMLFEVMDNPSFGSCTKIWKFWWSYTKIVSSRIVHSKIQTPKNRSRNKFICFKIKKKTSLAIKFLFHSSFWDKKHFSAFLLIVKFNRISQDSNIWDKRKIPSISNSWIQKD